MSQSNWLSQFDLSTSSKQSAAESLAADFLANRKAKHLDFTMRMEGGGSGNGDAGQGSANAGGAGGEGGQSSDGSQGQGGSSSDGGDPQRKITALEEEKNRHFEARQAAETAKQAAEQELQKFRDAEAERERAGNDELTNTKKDLEAARSETVELRSALEAALLDNAFLTENEYTWQNPARVLKLVDRATVEIKDGEVKGVKDALKALAESDPYLLKKSDEDNSSNGGGNGGNNSSSTSGQRTGNAGNGNRNNSNNGGKSAEELKRKYSALRR